MILTKKQEEGLHIAIERYKNKEKYTVIGGYAGVGKSSLVKFIIEALYIDINKVCYTAFTGKAAEVLKKKGNHNVCTLHKLLYDHFPKPEGGFFRKPKKDIPYSVVVVDEISMAPKSLMELLASHKCHIICLGDPFQLPPINKDEDNHLLDHPHIFLDEIMRQAEDSEIIQLSMKIRKREPISLFNGNNVKVLSKETLNTGMLTWADQILVGTNATRQNINNQMRALLGRGSLPEDGDKVICLRNYWDDINENGDSLVNGTIGYLKNPFETFYTVPRFIKTDKRKLEMISSDFIIDKNTSFNYVLVDKQLILNGERCCDWKVAYQLGKLKDKIGDVVPKEFAYAYAITGHKSQGSEWDKVLVIEETFPFDKTEHARWLYTTVTRASKKLVLIRNE